MRQLELAASCDDPAERAARCTFVVAGAGYTGTEVAAHGQLLTRAAARQRPALAGQPIRWLLLDLAARVLPELGSPRSTAGWSWTRTWPCPATRSCSRPVMWRRSPTSPDRAGSPR